MERRELAERVRDDAPVEALIRDVVEGGRLRDEGVEREEDHEADHDHAAREDAPRERERELLVRVLQREVVEVVV